MSPLQIPLAFDLHLPQTFNDPYRDSLNSSDGVGDGGVAWLVGNGLLKQYQAGDRHAVGEPCLAALEQWAEGQGARSTGQGEDPWTGLS